MEGEPKIDFKIRLMAELYKHIRDYGETLEDTYNRMSKDNEGKVRERDFLDFFDRFGMNYSIHDLKKLFKAIDNNNIGHINYDDFKIYITEASNAYKRYERQKDIMKNAQSLSSNEFQDEDAI